MEAICNLDGMFFVWLKVLQAVVYMLSLLSLVGTAGNALVLYVFMRRKDRLVSTVYIISLAVVDFTTCLIVIPFTVFMELLKFDVNSDFVCKVGETCPRRLRCG